MPNEFTSIPDDFSTPAEREGDAMPFAVTPAWERGKKRRGFGGGRTTRVAAEPRPFAAEPETVAMAGPAAMATETAAYGGGRLDAVDPTDTTFAATPAYATRSAARK